MFFIFPTDSEPSVSSVGDGVGVQSASFGLVKSVCFVRVLIERTFLCSSAEVKSFHNNWAQLLWKDLTKDNGETWQGNGTLTEEFLSSRENYHQPFDWQ